MTQEILHMKITCIQPNLRIVCSGEAIEELCRSIRVGGQLEPVRVRLAEGVFRIVDGEKRWRACRKLKMTHIEAVLCE